MDKKKILVVAGGLQIGGAERVAANISKYSEDDTFEFHYLVFEGNENVYGPEILERGGKVITVPQPRKNYVSYIINLWKLMKQHRYAAVHSHTMFNSGINLAVAWINRIPIRIAHSHTTKTEVPVSLAQKIYEYLMRQLVVFSSTHYFACGVDAGEWLFGRKVFQKKGYVMRNGIDTEMFAWSEKNRTKIRTLYGVEEAFVIGHTGTLVKVKNQKFLIEQMPDILRKKTNAVLMLVGGNEGNELENLKATAKECGVEERVIFCGAVLNTNEYLSAFDVFVFPSTREGTPLALLEAQTNGLPCIVSENVPTDAFLTDLVTTLPLNNLKTWVHCICSASRIMPEQYQAKVADAGYDARSAYNQIYEIYRGMEMQQKAIVSLSFDDGRGDNAEVVDQILLPKGIPATLNITTGYIDGTCPVLFLPSTKEPMKKEDVIRFAASPLIEIALHGDQHQNTPDDIMKGRKKLMEWLGKDEKYLFGFASPKSELSIKTWDSPQFRELRCKLLYMRTSFRIESYHFMRTIFRKIGRVLHIPLLYKVAFADSAMRFRDDKIIYSVCVHRDITFQQVRALIEDSIKKNASVTLMFHSIIDDCTGEDTWSWGKMKFMMLCDYLAKMREEGKLDVLTTREMIERMQ